MFISRSPEDQALWFTHKSCRAARRRLKAIRLCIGESLLKQAQKGLAHRVTTV